MIASIMPPPQARPILRAGLCVLVTIVCLLLPALLLTFYPSNFTNPMKAHQYSWRLAFTSAVYLLINGVTMQIAVAAILQRDPSKLWQWARYQGAGLLGLFFIFGLPFMGLWKLIR